MGISFATFLFLKNLRKELPKLFLGNGATLRLERLGGLEERGFCLQNSRVFKEGGVFWIFNPGGWLG